MRLALEAGVLVRADRLVDDLWGDDAVNTRRNTLQSKVARLRRALGRPAGDRQRRRRLRARGRAVRRSMRSPCCATRPPRLGCSTPATTARAADLCASTLAAVPRGRAAGRRRRRVGRPAPGPARRGADEAGRDPVLGAAAARRRRRRDRRAGSGGGDVPVPGGPVGAADHRAVPGRPPGRRAGDLPAGPEPAGRRARPRPGTAAAAARAADPDPRPVARRAAAVGRTATRRPGTCRRCRPSWSAARRRSPRSSDLLADERLVEIVGPGGIGKTAVAIATGRRLAVRAGRPAASGWPGSRPRRRPTTSSTR